VIYVKILTMSHNNHTLVPEMSQSFMGICDTLVHIEERTQHETL